MSDNDIGMIGLAVMGRNLALNMADRGFKVAVYNRTEGVTREVVAGLEPGQQVQACYSLDELVTALSRPRKVMLMVHAGVAVDDVLAALRPLLDPGDVVVDGGNSFFEDTDRRAKALEAEGIYFMGVGISGGEYGARNGPSIMPGGHAEAYDLVRPIFEAIAARADGGPCVSYLGPGAAGHYVKMVHNGIEYGIMQAISETYALMRSGLGLSNEDLARIYSEWNAAELQSYLVEITADIFRTRDPETGAYLVDLIVGKAEQKGTGMWASQSAMDLHVPVPSIDVAVTMRNLSGLDRPAAAGGAAAGAGSATARAAAGPGATAAQDSAAPADGAPLGAASAGSPATVALTPEHVRRALYAAVVLTYAQGFSQLRAASTVYGFDLDLGEVASIWRGGCIIRSSLLGDFKAAFRRLGRPATLLEDGVLRGEIATRRGDLVRTVEAGMAGRIPVPGMMAALGYLEAYSAPWLPSNLIQAQRDYFGAHTYRRIDRDGVFHTDWLAAAEAAEWPPSGQGRPSLSDRSSGSVGPSAAKGAAAGQDPSATGRPE